MKKLLCFTILFLALFGFESRSYALDDLQIGVKFGGALPYGDFTEDFDKAFAYGIFGEVAFTPYLSIEGALMRHMHEEGDDGVNELFPIHFQMFMFPDVPEENFDGEKELTITELTFNGKLYLPGAVMFRPFVTAGVGAYFWAFDIQNLGDHTETNFGANAGGGFVLNFTNRFYMGIEARYTKIWSQLAADDFGIHYTNVTATFAYGF